VIRVLHAGLSTSVQDRGRYGYYHLGIPPSGALDQYSYRAANLLLGNDAGAAALEVTFMGPRLEFQQDTAVAVTGAELPPTLNGEAVPMWRALRVKAGDTLSFGHLKRGARAYIAVLGGLDVPEVLGSRSTYALGGMGGFQGRTLRAGDELPVGTPQADFRERELDARLIPAFSNEVEVRVMMGLYDHLLSDEGRAAFLGTTWRVSPEADRIGYRYRADGVRLAFRERTPPFGAGSDPSNIVDAAYPVGSVQVPGGTEPIVLHRDAVSGGGYAMICTVIASDMDKVGQTQPNYRTRFVPLELDAALRARAEYRERMEALEEALG
jgi:biotin-dependent carboxylase-like uncharacterized protein